MLGLGSSLVLLASTTALGCASSAALRAAERGDQKALADAIRGPHERGELSAGEAARLAKAVAEREITTAKDEAAALARLDDLEICALDLDDALAERMKTRDGAGAEAALLRFEAGHLSDGDARDLLKDPDARYRAIGTRMLRRGGDGDARRAALVDPSGPVRRGALEASKRARDAADLDVLLETARVDPELIHRNLAVRTLSAIVRDDERRAAELSTRLSDLWVAADDALREDIAVAWALEPVFAHGGREALVTIVAEGRGPGAIAAAAVVRRNVKKPPELVGSASALLARTIREGSRRDRAHAMAAAPLEGQELEALRQASKEDDLDVRVSALSRLLESKADREAAVQVLTPIAGRGTKASPTDDPRLAEAGVRARQALARAGDRRIQAWIEDDLVATVPQRRIAAAYALAALGRASRGAPLLADPEPSVRTRVACILLTAARD